MSIFLGELPDLNSNDNDIIITSAQPQKHRRPHSPIPPDAEVIEILDTDTTTKSGTSSNRYKYIIYYFYCLSLK